MLFHMTSVPDNQQILYLKQEIFLMTKRQTNILTDLTTQNYKNYQNLMIICYDTLFIFLFVHL